ncbi:hypothetical protein WG922_11635 [Ramlibacter sp. AN1015]|uniref:hypothetical protein n=1 Tax=Ramlibacter sp. AN1015 TaxID=3133428 RepID=UPI0030C4BA93
MSHPHPMVSAWAARLCARPLPVLGATREALAALRPRSDRLDANALAQLVLQDPLMAVRVLTEAQQRFSARLSRTVETVTAALVLLGIDPFFATFSGLDTVEERLASQPQALAGFRAALPHAWPPRSSRPPARSSGCRWACPSPGSSTPRAAASRR